MFREAYHITWSQPNTAAVLSCVSNYMVMDDHDICDNWGDSPEDDFVMRPLAELRKAFPNKSEKWMLETRKKFFCARCAFEVSRGSISPSTSPDTTDNDTDSCYHDCAPCSRSVTSISTRFARMKTVLIR